MRSPTGLIWSVAAAAALCAALATPASAAPVPSSQPAAKPQPPRDPFSKLKVVISKDRLPVLRSIRPRNRKERQDRSRRGKISVTISTSPGGAAVYWGKARLGTTPLRITARRNSTPMDLVIRARGRMTLRTRVQRRVTRRYYFKLVPAKFR